MNKVLYKNIKELPPISEDSEIRNACYLCGRGDRENDKLTEEHVVPKVLFSGSDPGQYIKLWAHNTCNQSKGWDDEYVARFLQQTSFSKEAERAIEGFWQRMGVKPNKDGLIRPVPIEARGLLEGMKKSWRQELLGLLLELVCLGRYLA